MAAQDRCPICDQIYCLPGCKNFKSIMTASILWRERSNGFDFTGLDLDRIMDGKLRALVDVHVSITGMLGKIDTIIHTMALDEGYVDPEPVEEESE